MSRLQLKGQYVCEGENVNFLCFFYVDVVFVLFVVVRGRLETTVYVCLALWIFTPM